jgi:Family of unknown function (DUF6090)
MTPQSILGALAEIAIIVIGILIALAVDRWKESRADRRLEFDFLRGLERDLSQDSSQLAEYCDEVRTALAEAENLLEVLRGNAEPAGESFGGQLIRTANGNEPIYSLTAYTELSSGYLRLIRNDALRCHIVEYYSAILTGERARSPITPQLWYDTGIQPFLVELWDILPAGDWLGWFQGAPAELDTQEIVRRLRESSTVEGHLEGARRSRHLQLTKFAFHQIQADALLAEVQAELGKGSD